MQYADHIVFNSFAQLERFRGTIEKSGREIDLALSRHPQMMSYISQPVDQRCGWEDAQQALFKVTSDG